MAKFKFNGVEYDAPPFYLVYSSDIDKRYYIASYQVCINFGDYFTFIGCDCNMKISHSRVLFISTNLELINDYLNSLN